MPVLLPGQPAVSSDGGFVDPYSGSRGWDEIESSVVWADESTIVTGSAGLAKAYIYTRFDAISICCGVGFQQMGGEAWIMSVFDPAVSLRKYPSVGTGAVIVEHFFTRMRARDDTHGMLQLS